MENIFHGPKTTSLDWGKMTSSVGKQIKLIVFLKIISMKIIFLYHEVFSETNTPFDPFDILLSRGIGTAVCT